MKIRLNQKVKDSHKLIIETEKGPEIVSDVQLFQAGDILESNDSNLPEARLRKLLGYGYAEELTDG